ncbi:MAG TPA: TlpA disulfide reductase family protein [Terriglobales bacterium]|nr:TlpA disulfide reductase family protein [Terriglobales bacterium]
MEKTREIEMNHNGEDGWVENRLATLNPEPKWQPDPIRGMAQLREQRSTGRGRDQRWIIWAVAAAAACVCLMAFPAPRVFAHYCLNCSVELWQSLSTPAPSFAIKPKSDRQIAPDFTLNNASGAPVKLSEFEGKVVLLNFWATWCGGCAVEIPWFVEFASKYRDRGFSVIGVSMDDDGWKSVKPYIEKKKVNYPVVIGNTALGERYGLSSMPMTLIIDQSGRIASTHVGLVRKSDYQAEIETLLNSDASAPGSSR